jgi:hypothetical protein
MFLGLDYGTWALLLAFLIIFGLAMGVIGSWFLRGR